MTTVQTNKDIWSNLTNNLILEIFYLPESRNTTTTKTKKDKKHATQKATTLVKSVPKTQKKLKTHNYNCNSEPNLV